MVFGSVNAATARVLAADGYEVVAPPQGCCGALSMHAGRGDEGRAFARRVIEAFDGVETVIVNTSGCGSHLKELGHVLGDDPAWAERAAAFSARVRDLGEFLTEVEPRASRHPLNLKVAMQDSCHLRHAQRLPLSSAVSLRRIPGLTVVEPAEQDICCGSAGIYNITQPDAARQLGDRKAAHVLATGAQVYASANPGCLVQVATALRRAGSPLPALHPIELVDASIRNIGAAGLLRRPAASRPARPRSDERVGDVDREVAEEGERPDRDRGPGHARDRGRRRGRPSRAARRRRRGSAVRPDQNASHGEEPEDRERQRSRARRLPLQAPRNDPRRRRPRRRPR